MKSWFAVALFALAATAHAQNPRALLDTDRGPIVVELDQTRAPNTVANFFAYIDAKTYDNTLFHRVRKDFVVQGGGYKEDTSPVTRRPSIASERNNGLTNVPGTLAMALSNNANGTPNQASASSDFFFNTGTNTSLNADFTVFGRVIFGTATLAAMNSTTVLGGSENPVRMPLLKRAARVEAGAFPILDLHTGAWYDPAKSGRGFNIEISKTPSGTDATPLLVVYWYDYFEGKQIWMNGAVPFAWGASEVTLPMQITRGAQFGGAFNPADVVTDADWGQLTLRFTACDAATVSFTSDYGNGTATLARITQPVGSRCAGN
jgi:cyclophilin family peptidyl-prolyl cis-trans isomerase